MPGILMTDPGFGRGQTLGVKDVSQGTSITGTQKVFTDSDPRTQKGGIHLSNRAVTCIAVRNTSGAALMPGKIVAFKDTAILDEVTAPVASTAAGKLYGVVDEYLPATTGCPDKDVCWVVVSGPTAIASTVSALKAGAVIAGGASGNGVAGDAAAKPTEVIGLAIKDQADGFVRTLVGTGSEHGI